MREPKFEIDPNYCQHRESKKVNVRRKGVTRKVLRCKHCHLIIKEL